MRNSSFRISTANSALAGQCGEELVQPVGEALGVDAARFCQRLELEDERTGVLGEVALVGLVDLLHEQFGVEEIRVDLPGPGRVLSLGEGVDGELAPDLADAGKARWQMLGVARQAPLRWGPIEARINADGPEEGKGGVLLEHL